MRFFLLELVHIWRKNTHNFFSLCIEMPHGYLILLHTVQCLKHHAQLLAHIRNERINDRMNDERKKNWTERFTLTNINHTLSVYMQCKRLQFCKIKHANALHHQTALDFAAIAIDKHNRPVLEKEKTHFNTKKPNNIVTMEI